MDPKMKLTFVKSYMGVSKSSFNCSFSRFH